VEVPLAASEPAAQALAPPAPAEASISSETLRQAIEDGRLVFHLQPIVSLPQRKTLAYDLVPRLALDGDKFAERADFVPKRGGEALLCRVERRGVEEAVAIARRARAGGQPATLFVPMSRATLVDALMIEKTVALLDGNRAVAGNIALLMDEAEWSALPLNEKAALAAFVGKGAKLALAGCPSLRLDFARLAGEGVTSVRVDATQFLASPEAFTDFHTADVVPYIRRFEVDLIASGVMSEEQLLMLLEDGISLVQGPHVSPPMPERADLAGDRQAPARARLSAEA
jgi:cyclic-di-GMP phosphodiesterase TipF (flagellum assembly factor)